MPRITGPFRITMTPQPPDEGAPPSAQALGRMVLDKRYEGALDATGYGQMLAVRSATPGSAGYVAMELVAGTLAGRAGTFALQHSGTMDRGAPTLRVSVVPDSGTDGLEGLAGELNILNEGGAHSYVFDYTLPDLA